MSEVVNLIKSSIKINFHSIHNYPSEASLAPHFRNCMRSSANQVGACISRSAGFQGKLGLASVFLCARGPIGVAAARVGDRRNANRLIR